MEIKYRQNCLEGICTKTHHVKHLSPAQTEQCSLTMVHWEQPAPISGVSAWVQETLWGASSHRAGGVIPPAESKQGGNLCFRGGVSVNSVWGAREL